MKKENERRLEQDDRGLPNDPRKTDFEKSELENDVSSNSADKDSPTEGNKNPEANRPANERTEEYRESYPPGNRSQGSRGEGTEEFIDSGIPGGHNGSELAAEDTTINKRENEDVIDSDPNRRKEKDPNRVTDPESFNNNNFNGEDVTENDDDANLNRDNHRRDKNRDL